MTQPSWPFDVSEDTVLEIIQKTARQHHDQASPRIGREIRIQLQFHVYNTTNNLVVTAVRHELKRLLVYVSAVAPSGKRSELETEVTL